MPTNLISALPVPPVPVAAVPGSSARGVVEAGSPPVTGLGDALGPGHATPPLGSWLALFLAAQQGETRPPDPPQGQGADTADPDGPAATALSPEKIVEKEIGNWAWLLAGVAPANALLQPLVATSSREELPRGSTAAPETSLASAGAAILQMLAAQPNSGPVPAGAPPQGEVPVLWEPATPTGVEPVLPADAQPNTANTSNTSFAHPQQVQVERITPPAQNPLAQNPLEPAELAFAVTLRASEETAASSARPAAKVTPVSGAAPQAPLVEQVTAAVPTTPVPPVHREIPTSKSTEIPAESSSETVASTTDAAIPSSRPAHLTEFVPPKTTVSQGIARMSAPFAHRAEPGNGSLAASAPQADPKPQPDAGTSVKAEAHGNKVESNVTGRPAARVSQATAANPQEHPAMSEPGLANPNALPTVESTVSVKSANPRPVSQPASIRDVTLDMVRTAVLEQRVNPAPALREVAFRVTDLNRAAQATVQLFERDGRIQVAVRTLDVDLAKELRTGLNELLTNLEKSGFRSEPWKLSAVEASTNESMHDASTQNGARHQEATPDAGRNGQQQSRNPFRRTPNDQAEANLAEEWNPWM